MSKNEIIAAAIDLVTNSGYGSLTMRTLAAHMHVRHYAIYNHLRSKDQLLSLIAGNLMALIDIEGLELLPWPTGIRRWALSYYEVFCQHPGLIPFIVAHPLEGAPATRMYEALAIYLWKNGWPENKVIPGIMALEALIFGNVLLADSRSQSRMGMFAEHQKSEQARIRFEIGLDAFLAGIF